MKFNIKYHFPIMTQNFCRNLRTILFQPKIFVRKLRINIFKYKTSH